MKVSEQWLREWADAPVDTDTLVEQLTARLTQLRAAARTGGIADSPVYQLVRDLRPGFRFEALA